MSLRRGIAGPPKGQREPGPTLASRITFAHLAALESDETRGFWDDVDVRDNPYDCWEWTRAASNYYGRVNIPRYITGLERPVMMLAHRVALSLRLGGLLPAGMVVDHVCGNGLCCNPSHLELVTTAENTRRSRRTIEEIRAPRWGLDEEHLITHSGSVYAYTNSLLNPPATSTVRPA